MRAPSDTPDPNDPLAPRPDDPMFFRRGWWWARLYDRPASGTTRLRTSFVIVLMLLVLGLVALGVVWLGQR